jgi:hypothetical protein
MVDLIDRKHLMIRNISRLCMLAAGPVFASGLVLMQPQIAVLATLEGDGVFLKSLAMEPNAWSTGHLLLTAAALLYLAAGIGAGAVVASRNQWMGGLISVLFVVGFAGLIGQFALDFSFGALASGLEAEVAQAARISILSDPLTQALFVQGAPAVTLLGMLVLSLTALITGWAPRMTGVLVIVGWAIVIGLNSVIPYAEVAGHFVIGIGFWFIAAVKQKP